MSPTLSSPEGEGFQPSPKGTLMNAVVAEIEDKAAYGVQEAIRWVGNVNRKLVKGLVMTLSYGVTRKGAQEMIQEELKKTDPPLFPPDQVHEQVVYLADLALKVAKKTVVAPYRLMEWFRKAAREAVKSGKPITWTGPGGLPVVQPYIKQRSVRLECTLSKKRTTLSVKEDTDTIDTRKQADKIAPNFIHSMDAMRLMGTVNKCIEAGIKSFAVVHDSYGTHACQIDTMNALLRDTFAEKYSVDVLSQFRDGLRRKLPEGVAVELPAPPQTRNLNVEDVKRSRYFFS